MINTDTDPTAPDPLVDARQLLAERDRAGQLLADAERQAAEAEAVAAAVVQTRDEVELRAAKAALGLDPDAAAPIRARHERDITAARKQAAATRDQADAAHRLVEVARQRLAELDRRVRPALDAAVAAHQAACDARMVEIETRYRSAATALQAAVAEALTLAAAGGHSISVASADPWAAAPDRIELIGSQVQQARLWDLVVPAPFPCGTHHGNLLEGRDIELEPSGASAFADLAAGLEALRALAAWLNELNATLRAERSKAPPRAA